MKRFAVTADIARLVLDNPEAIELQRMVASAQLSALDSGLEIHHIDLLRRLAYDACFTRDEQDYAVIPSVLISNLMYEGAQRSEASLTLADQVKTAGPAQLWVDDQRVDTSTCWEYPERRIDVPGINEVGVRTVPMLRQAQITFALDINTDRVKPTRVLSWLQDGLNLRGLGYLRPNFGRGQIRAMTLLEDEIRDSAQA